MALTIDSHGRDVQTQREIARLRAEALATPEEGPQAHPVTPVSSGLVELPASIDRRPLATPVASTPAEPLPPASDSGSAQPVLSVEVNAFIPDAQISTPFYVPDGGTFIGDGRQVGEDGTQRTQQQILIFADPTQPSGYRVELPADVGLTQRVDDDGNVVETGEAPLSGLQAEVTEVREDGTIVVTMTGQAADPLVTGAPGLSYDMVVEMKPNADGTWTVTSSGKHDSFPGYEVLATVGNGEQQVVYGYDPGYNGAGALNLLEGEGGLLGLIWGDSRVNAEGSLTLGAERLTPETLVARHTTNGVVDTEALGSDLADSAEAGSVDPAFVEEVFAALPEDQRSAAANAFFDGLSRTPGPGGGPAHDEYIGLALTPAGMEVILAVGQHAPGRLASDEILYAFGLHNREAMYGGDVAAIDAASAYLQALGDNPEAQYNFAHLTDPLYDDETSGLASTAEGRALQEQINRILG
ncbi:DUF3238 domain-containing protein [Luteimonas salinilitoris]|uniref:DUF3238 domain-containing protein n=1 Tax=Luteimonas salinilitoris TaxID=3237697 RepID=A0ABV4HZ39_9GAMM